MSKDGQAYEPPLKGLIAPYQLAYKKRVYSPNRIKYPLKRVDWDPEGERNPQNRGKSKYERICWDEATTIIADEIRRIHKEYGPCGILAHGDGHGETKIVHGPHAVPDAPPRHPGRLHTGSPERRQLGGLVLGSEACVGQGENGLMLPADNIFNDVTQNTDMLVHIGADLETTPWGFAGQFPSGVLFYWSRLGKKQVFVSPDLNYSAPSTPTSGYRSCPTPMPLCNWPSSTPGSTKGPTTRTTWPRTWSASTSSRTTSWDEEDGVPKTPEWASAKCGVPEWTIKGPGPGMGSR